MLWTIIPEMIGVLFLWVPTIECRLNIENIPMLYYIKSDFSHRIHINYGLNARDMLRNLYFCSILILGLTGFDSG